MANMKWTLENDVNDFVKKSLENIGLEKHKDFNEESSMSDYLKEALKGSAALASAIFLARTGASKDEIRQHIIDNYYPMDFTLATISGEWRYGCSSQVTVPHALQAFFESETFEDSIRKAIFIGGDTDTVASMAGAIAGAFYGVPDYIAGQLDGYLTEHLAKIVHEFHRLYSTSERK